MKGKIKLIVGVAALVAVIGLSTLLYQYLSQNYKPQNGLLSEDPATGEVSAAPQESPAPDEPEEILAPDFSVVDGDGNTVKLSDFLGKPVVVNFWASWCPPCKAEMPEFDTLWKELGEDVAFLMINATDGTRETEEIAKTYIEDQEFEFPVYYDTNQEAAYVYGISSLPTTLFIDAEGYFVKGIVGMLDGDTLRKGIDLIVPANSAAEVPEAEPDAP